MVARNLFPPAHHWKVFTVVRNTKCAISKNPHSLFSLILLAIRSIALLQESNKNFWRLIKYAFKYHLKIYLRDPKMLLG